MRIFTEEPTDNLPSLATKVRSAFSALLTKYKPNDNRNQHSSTHIHMHMHLSANTLSGVSGPSIFRPVHCGQQEGSSQKVDENTKDKHNRMGLMRKCMQYYSHSEREKSQAGQVVVNLKEVNRIANQSQSTCSKQAHPICQYGQYHNSLEYIKQLSYLATHQHQQQQHNETTSLYKLYGTHRKDKPHQGISREDLQHARMMRERKDMLKKRYHQIIEKERQQDRQQLHAKIYIKNERMVSRQRGHGHGQEYGYEQQRSRSRSRDKPANKSMMRVKNKNRAERVYDIPEKIQIRNRQKDQDNQSEHLIRTKCKATQKQSQTTYRNNNDEDDQQRTRKKNAIKKINTFQQRQYTYNSNSNSKQSYNQSYNQNSAALIGEYQRKQQKQKQQRNKSQNKIEHAQSNIQQTNILKAPNQIKVDLKITQSNPFRSSNLNSPSQPIQTQQQKLESNPFLAKNLKNLDLKSIIFGNSQPSNNNNSQQSQANTNLNTIESTPARQIGSQSKSSLNSSPQSQQTPTFKFANNSQFIMDSNNKPKNEEGGGGKLFNGSSLTPVPTQRMNNSYNTSNFLNMPHQSTSNHNTNNNTSNNINYNNTNNTNNNYSVNKSTISPSNFTFHSPSTTPSSFPPNYSPSSLGSTVTFAASSSSTACFPKYNQVTVDMLNKNSFEEYNKKAAAVFFVQSQDQQSLFGDTDRTARKNKSQSNTGKKRGGPARIA